VSDLLHIEDLSVSLGGRRILDGLALELEPSRYGVVLGPSGCGKSTLLRSISGLVDVDSGTVRIGERTVCSARQIVPPEERPVGFAFQSLALWPHMTVAGHLDYALQGRRVPRSERGERIVDTLEPLGLKNLVDRRPQALSGGERQRLALARALVTRPGLLLLDEPTSSVDPLTAREIRVLLSGIRDRFGTTVLHVTHDQEEALDLADAIFVMNEGRILQRGTAAELYERPRSRAVARFVGEGALLPATLRAAGVAECPLGVVPVEAAELEGPVWILVRPESLALAAEGGGIPVTVQRSSYRGGCWRCRVLAGDQELVVDLVQAPDPGSTVRIEVVRPAWVVEKRGRA
jgi:iron(III) transport system ATP-binding protein